MWSFGAHEEHVRRQLADLSVVANDLGQGHPAQVDGAGKIRVGQNGIFADVEKAVAIAKSCELIDESGRHQGTGVCVG